MASGRGAYWPPILFALFLAAVIEEMSGDTLDAIYIRIRLDGGLLILHV